jgi:eukaryotic-like serine/threonine-protein kinase
MPPKDSPVPCDPRIQELLEEAINSNRTADELCAECPEFLDEVRRRLEQFRSMEAHVDALFPPSNPTESGHDN